MKTFVQFLLMFCSLTSLAQRERAIDLSGSGFVVVKYRDFSKDGSNPPGLKFLNAETGQAVKVEFDQQTNIKTLEHLKLDSHGIDDVLVITTRAEKKNPGMAFTSKVLLYSHDGKLIRSASIEQSVDDFVINKKSARIILISTSNRMKSGQKTDVQSEFVFDLKTLKQI